MSANTEKTVTIRKMQEGECHQIADILLFYANQAVLLWRTPEDILAHKDNFFVAQARDEIIGCVALQDYGDGLYELRSLAVKEGHGGLGLGSSLVRAVVQEAGKRRGRELFALTKKVDFFRKLGFGIEPKERFPQKVWKDCQLCNKRDHCDETAVAVRFSGPEA